MSASYLNSGHAKHRHRPSFLSGLSDAELALVKHKVERHVSPEIAETRDATLKAMKEAEAGWQRAIDKIAEYAGLTKCPDGRCMILQCQRRSNTCPSGYSA